MLPAYDDNEVTNTILHLARQVNRAAPPHNNKRWSSVEVWEKQRRTWEDIITCGNDFGQAQSVYS